MPNPILQIALDIPLDRLFDYLAGDFKVEIGCRVIVPFGNRELVGIVVSISSTSTLTLDKLKPIKHAFVDETPLSTETLSLIKFTADYYQAPFGQALVASLPLRLRQTKPAVSRKAFVYALNENGRLLDLETIAKKQLVQRKILSALANQTLTESGLNALSSSWRKAILPLIESGLITKSETLATPKNVEKAGLAPQLNAEQQTATEQISHTKKGFAPYCLHGITGSGKTEVYIRLIEQFLNDRDAQVLVLVPEINLTPQLEARFRSRLPQYTLVSLHSHLSESERLQNWQLAQVGLAQIIIGTRLSVFTPLPNLKLIIVDEEHDGSYKQQDGMRYHARDIAMVRAQKLKIPIVLGSATPSLETWHNALNKKFKLLTLNNRAVEQSQLPTIHTIDTTKQVPDDGLTLTLRRAIQDRLNKGEQSLLFINRRGYAPVLFCNACQWVAPCMRCSAKLVVHLRLGKLRCHHCGHEQRILKQCPSCGNADLHPTGHGTQRLEETLKAAFPTARIARVDRDSTRNKDALNDTLIKVHNNEIDILIGTQMLAKGHDFPNLTLVGVIDTDSALYSPDLRASERLFAQLMQVSGRAGRAAKAGEVFIQTAFPEHHLFNALRSQDYNAYAATLLTEREIAQFPPFIYLAIIRAEANDYQAVQQFLNHALETGRGLSNQVLIYDVARPQMERLKGMERGQLLMQAKTRAALQNLLRNLTTELRQHRLNNKIRWVIDVDPLEF